MASEFFDIKGNDGAKERPFGFGSTVFLHQAAHVAVVDACGCVITVNDAWRRFGRENKLSAGYEVIGASYLQICERAIDATRGGEGVRDVLAGMNDIFAAKRDRFSIVYPCHAPREQRWFLMYARPFGGSAQPHSAKGDGAVVSHIDVTSLRLAGLIPDDTEITRHARTADPRGTTATAAERHARRLLFPAIRALLA